jgi:hypothetical protein
MSCGGFPALLVFDAVRAGLSRLGEFCVVAPVLVDDGEIRRRAELLRRGGFRLAASHLANDDVRWFGGGLRRVVALRISGGGGLRWVAAAASANPSAEPASMTAANNRAIKPRTLASLMPVIWAKPWAWVSGLPAPATVPSCARLASNCFSNAPAASEAANSERLASTGPQAARISCELRSLHCRLRLQMCGAIAKAANSALITPAGR